MTTQTFHTPSSFLSGIPLDVCVVGAGGTGSMLLDGLARLDCALRSQGHPGMKTVVYDPDTVSESNIGRQRFTRSDVGFNKAILMVHRLNAFYGLDWTASPKSFKPHDVGWGLDLLVGCVDRGQFRFELGEDFSKRTHCETLWLDTGNGADSGQALLSHLGIPDAPLRLPNVYDLFGAQLLAGDNNDQPSCSLAEALARQRWSINPMVANVALSLLDKLFHRGALTDHGAFIRLDPMSVAPIPIDTDYWSTFGYVPSSAR